MYTRVYYLNLFNFMMIFYRSYHVTFYLLSLFVKVTFNHVTM